MSDRAAFCAMDQTSSVECVTLDTESFVVELATILLHKEGVSLGLVTHYFDSRPCFRTKSDVIVEHCVRQVGAYLHVCRPVTRGAGEEVLISIENLVFHI